MWISRVILRLQVNIKSDLKIAGPTLSLQVNPTLPCKKVTTPFVRLGVTFGPSWFSRSIQPYHAKWQRPFWMVSGDLRSKLIRGLALVCALQLSSLLSFVLLLLIRCMLWIHVSSFIFKSFDMVHASHYWLSSSIFFFLWPLIWMTLFFLINYLSKRNFIWTHIINCILKFFTLMLFLIKLSISL